MFSYNLYFYVNSIYLKQTAMTVPFRNIFLHKTKSTRNLITIKYFNGDCN